MCVCVCVSVGNVIANFTPNALLVATIVCPVSQTPV